MTYSEENIYKINSFPFAWTVACKLKKKKRLLNLMKDQRLPTKGD